MKLARQPGSANALLAVGVRSSAGVGKGFVNCRPLVEKPGSGFTLIEMLIVLAIIGILASISAPAFKGLGQGNTRAAAERQLLDDLGFARQMAIKNRSTVYLAFVPPNLVVESGGVTLFQSSYQSIEKFISAVSNQAVRDQLRPKMLRSLTNAFVGQNVSYAVISSRSAGDQPGQNHEQYLSDWKSLPDGMVFPNWMFNTNLFQGRTNILNLVNYTRNRTDVPFPMALPNGTKSNPTPPRAVLPAIAFSPTGQMDLSSSARFSLGLSKAGPLPDFYLGLGEGSVFLPKQAGGGYNLGGTMDLIETPKDNYTNSIIRVAGLTGRAKLEKPVLRP